MSNIRDTSTDLASAAMVAAMARGVPGGRNYVSPTGMTVLASHPRKEGDFASAGFILCAARDSEKLITAVIAGAVLSYVPDQGTDLAGDKMLQAKRAILAYLTAEDDWVSVSQETNADTELTDADLIYAALGTAEYLKYAEGILEARSTLSTKVKNFVLGEVSELFGSALKILGKK